MKKILVSDFDGTFYLKNVDINDNIKNVENFRSNGNLFIIATGRSYDEFKEALEVHPLSYDYLIINNGATILNEKHEFINNCIIKNWAKNRLFKDLDFSIITNIYGCNILKSKIDVKNKRLTKIHIEYQTLEQAKSVKDFINKKYKFTLKSYVIPTTKSVEIISSKCNKAKSVKKLAKSNKINKNNIYAIGDSYNDYDMIKSFNGYAMENAKPEIKEISIEVLPSVSSLIGKLLK